MVPAGNKARRLSLVNHTTRTMIIIDIITSFERSIKRVINYRHHKSFENKLFREELLFELTNSTLQENADGFEEFIEICQKL